VADVAFLSIFIASFLAIRTLKSRLNCPQAKRWVSYEEKLFSVVVSLPAVPEFLNIEALAHFLQVCVFESHRFDLFSRQVTWTVGDFESAFGRPMNLYGRDWDENDGELTI